ncbi:transposase [Streptomyces sp. SB3404]|uniref:Transposase n=1 Tax=Streptomyces boncukensis TaxID=2711219 RepID=A0A6G4WQL7_9ACTN|nr:transposase [Streptomyces boncukensis]
MHRESDGTYGVPRITAELRENGECVNHKRVARVMRSIGLAGVRLRRRHRTTVADPAAAKAPDLIGRDFTASGVNTKYVGDITCLPLESGEFPLPGHRHRPRLTSSDRLGDRGPHAHRSRHRRPGRRRTHARQPRRSSHTHRSRRPVHQSGIRRRLPPSRRPPVPERDRQLGHKPAAEPRSPHRRPWVNRPRSRLERRMASAARSAGGLVGGQDRFGGAGAGNHVGVHRDSSGASGAGGDRTCRGQDRRTSRSGVRRLRKAGPVRRATGVRRHGGALGCVAVCRVHGRALSRSM